VASSGIPSSNDLERRVGINCPHQFGKIGNGLPRGPREGCGGFTLQHIRRGRLRHRACSKHRRSVVKLQEHSWSLFPLITVNYVGDLTRSGGKVCRASDDSRVGQSPTAEFFADSALRLGLLWEPGKAGHGKAKQLTARALLPLFRGGGRGLLFRPALHSRKRRPTRNRSPFVSVEMYPFGSWFDTQFGCSSLPTAYHDLSFC
jgi:hypothetical protein